MSVHIATDPNHLDALCEWETYTLAMAVTGWDTTCAIIREARTPSRLRCADMDGDDLWWTEAGTYTSEVVAITCGDLSELDLFAWAGEHGVDLDRVQWQDHQASPAGAQS